MRVYIAGPMTWIPQFNFPAFDAAAERLRELGWTVISPAELDSPEHRAAALASRDGDPSAYNSVTGETWADLLARDVKLIADEVDLVVVLPGWAQSKGARLETFVARLTGKPIHFYDESAGVSVEVPEWSLDEAHAGPPTPADDRKRARVEDVSWPSIEVGKGGGRQGGEERVTNAKTGGQKGRKPQRFELLPWHSLGDIAEVYAFGASKYADHNWRRGYDWSLSFGALQRHLALFWEGQDCDEESGLPHLAHAGFHVLTLLTFMRERSELDDRASTVLELAA